jgi:hypothetical protein
MAYELSNDPNLALHAIKAPTVGAALAKVSDYIDVRLGFGHGGEKNAWARNNTGWNAIRQPVLLSAGVTYTLRGFVRSSGNVRDGYFGFRDAAQRPVSEIKYGPLHGYRELSVRFRPARTGTYNVFTGIWAPNQDARSTTCGSTARVRTWC